MKYRVFGMGNKCNDFPTCAGCKRIVTDKIYDVV